MNDTVTGGSLLCVPMDMTRGDPARFSVLLEHMSAHPMWFADQATPDDARLSAAWMLTDSAFWKYEIWSGGTFAGMFLLSRVIPKVDAVFHFTLLPTKETGVTLFGSRKLAWNFLGYAFDAFQLQRISVEVPEHQPKLAHWLRQRLGFRYEGETNLDRLRKNKGVTILDVPAAPAHISAVGSRRERSHWDGSEWRDLVLLRLLHSEYIARASLGTLPQATHESISEGSHESPIKTRAIQAVETAGASGGPALTAPPG